MPAKPAKRSEEPEAPTPVKRQLPEETPQLRALCEKVLLAGSGQEPAQRPPKPRGQGPVPPAVQPLAAQAVAPVAGPAAVMEPAGQPEPGIASL